MTARLDVGTAARNLGGMNKLRWRIGELLGHSIVVEITFLILAALFVFPAFGKTFDDHFAALLMAPILFISILVHELGHAVAIDRFRYGKSTILLWGMGGLCIGRGGRTPKHGLLISLAGPAAGLLIGIPALLLYLGLDFQIIPVDVGRTVTKALFFTVWVNVGWSILNLLPIFPLDGGQALMNILRMRGKSEPAATRTAGFIGLFVLAPLTLLAVFQLDIWMIFILFFIGRTTWTAYKTGRV